MTPEFQRHIDETDELFKNALKLTGHLNTLCIDSKIRQYANLGLSNQICHLRYRYNIDKAIELGLHTFSIEEIVYGMTGIDNLRPYKTNLVNCGFGWNSLRQAKEETYERIIEYSIGFWHFTVLSYQPVNQIAVQIPSSIVDRIDAVNYFKICNIFVGFGPPGVFTTPNAKGDIVICGAICNNPAPDLSSDKTYVLIGAF